MQDRAQAQRYPDRPLRVIIPFPTGSPPDTVVRIVGQQITANVGQAVVADARPGAGGTLGTDLGAKASPDGHTLLVAVLGPIGLAPSLYSRLAYDPASDFAPVTLLAFFPELLVTIPSAPFKSVKELIGVARAKPGQLTYASAGNGTLPHLSAVLFSKLADIRMIHVPYKGVIAALPDIMSGRADLAFPNIGTVLPHVNSGKLAALAVTGAARANLLPETPTMAEAGVSGFETNDWFGILAPKATPRRVVAELHGIILKAMQAPEVRTQLTNLGGLPVTNTPIEFASFIQAEIARWAEVIRFSGARVE
jgi:tripartite-type tricarboxylate transporter receptor subunit TctC